MKEQDLVNAIIDLIRYSGGVATRINAGMQVIDQPTGRRVVRGAPAGTSDILACYRGQYLAIECKIGSNKPTAAQEIFLADVEAAGGIALVAWDIETVVKTLEGLS